MSAIKERIIGAITIMTDADAEKIWKLIIDQFPADWTDIESIAPDEWDREMIQDIAKNPDCHDFLSAEDAMKELGLI